MTGRNTARRGPLLRAGVAVLLLVLAAFGSVLAQAGAAQNAATSPQPISSLAGPPLRVLGAALSVTTDSLASVSQVRALPGGRVLVNEGGRRRLLLLDSTMKLIKIVADSNSSSMNAYGLRTAKLLPYYGDSSILIDAGSYSMLVIDGDGNIVRVKAVPRTDHVNYYGSALSTTYGNPGFDAQGRLVYRINDPTSSLIVVAGGGIASREPPDSAPVLRLDFSGRKYDTVARVKIQKRVYETVQEAGGFVYNRALTNPMPVQDDWAVTSDGAVALLRHRDYSIDWVNPDGSRTSSQPIPFYWQRLTDDHKKAFVDSLKKAAEDVRKRNIARYDSINLACFNLKPGEAPTAAMLQGRGRAAAPPPPANTTMQTAARDGGGTRAVGTADAGRAAGAGATAGAPPPAGRPAPGATPLPGAVPAPATPPCPTAPYIVAQMYGPLGMVTSVIPYTALPDYKPPFSANAMRADADGNLWIRVNQMKPVPGTYHYDIVNRQGELIDRLQIPTARAIVGFGPGNIVYLTSRAPVTRPAPGSPATLPMLRLERVRWR